MSFVVFLLFIMRCHFIFTSSWLYYFAWDHCCISREKRKSLFCGYMWVFCFSIFRNKFMFSLLVYDSWSIRWNGDCEELCEKEVRKEVSNCYPAHSVQDLIQNGAKIDSLAW